jgi:hypothetical protein
VDDPEDRFEEDLSDGILCGSCVGALLVAKLGAEEGSKDSLEDGC